MKDTLLDNLHMADINPRICGVEACAPGHSFGPAVREYFLLHYVVRGHTGELGSQKDPRQQGT